MPTARSFTAGASAPPTPELLGHFLLRGQVQLVARREDAAADFDRGECQGDVAAYLATCASFGVPAHLERSRSGNGGHVWVFFDEPVPAQLARRAGAALLTRTMDGRYQIPIASYDRFFPNQDAMPRGGFGNLIALPLQGAKVPEGNSVFLDDQLVPHPDRWRYLSQVKKLNLSRLESIAGELVQAGDVIGVPLPLGEDDVGEDPWTLAAEQPFEHHVLPRQTEFQLPEPLEAGMPRIYELLAAIPEAAPRVLLATSRFAGEGFDDARLDTLFLALPIAWKGNLQQYVGRLHRLHAKKLLVQVWDYVDAKVPVLARMYVKRLVGYRGMGYTVHESTDAGDVQLKLWASPSSPA